MVIRRVVDEQSKENENWIETGWDGFVVETTIVLKLRGVGKNVQTVNSLSVSHHITVLVISFVLFS